jgi:hypothetical protein
VNGHPKYFSDEPDPSAWLKVLAEVRRMAPRQGYRFLHVQAVIVAIDQYAEAATGNRYYFLDNPQHRWESQERRRSEVRADRMRGSASGLLMS